jgi:hypothetical protein
LIATDTPEGAVIASGCSQTWNGASAIDILDTFAYQLEEIESQGLKATATRQREICDSLR